VRRRSDCGDALRDELAGNLQTLVEVRGPIVEARQDVVVQVNHLSR
jgi:hypothetical protein